MTTKKTLKPWAKRPFELIYHAEIHYLRGSDYDRRLALISFDNSIEISITTYLSLKPIQREDRQYQKKDVEKWTNNYHSKLDFFTKEIQLRGLPEYVEKAEIVWYHDQRNDQYHGNGSGIPEKETLDGIRKVALWVFSVLYESPDIAAKLEAAISESDSDAPSIPSEFVVPSEPTPAVIYTDPNKSKALAIAALLGNWDENNGADLDIATRLANGF